jgi:hypothetical protein
MDNRPGVITMETIPRFHNMSGNSKKNLVIIIATRTINSTNLFTNGLYQNILFFYKLFRCLGHHSIFLLNETPNNTNADLLINDGYEVLTPEQVLQTCDSVDLYIEIGMSVHVGFIYRLREMGARIVKLYLGNALNIDCEMIVNMNEVCFPHHIYSDIDEMWTSPHYKMNLDYLCGLYRISYKDGKIAPYIWDSSIIEKCCAGLVWRQPQGGWQMMDIVITEPNISYQKSALIPIILAEEFSRRFPSWKGRIIIMNSVRIEANIHLKSCLLPGLDIIRQGRVIFKGREDIVSLLNNNRSAVFVSHQINNEFNYLILELMYKGWPVLHNSDVWKNFGYYWTDKDLESACSLLQSVMKTHSGDEGKYSADARLLAWSYSMYNPDVQLSWQRLIDNCVSN